MDPKEILSELRNLYIAKSIIGPSENSIMEADDTVIIDKMTKKERSLKTKYVLSKRSLIGAIKIEEVEAAQQQVLKALN